MAFPNDNEKEDFENTYTERQKKAFAIFKGRWRETRFTLPPDYILFQKHYNKPVPQYKEEYMSGKYVAFRAQGECLYIKSDNSSSKVVYDTIPCYYVVDDYATKLYLYRQNSLHLKEEYKMDIQDQNTIVLQIKFLNMLYVFKKEF